MFADIVDQCSWNNPGHNPYQFNPAQAVVAYNFPKDVEAELIRKMEAKEYDDLVIIDKNSIYGLREYTNLSNMHFGKGRVCRNVDRSKWGSYMTRALVYCVREHCLIVPFICKNVARVDVITPRPFKEEDRQPRIPPEREVPKPTNKVPEPSTLLLLLFPLLYIMRKK